jgi:preprotein translocase subunit YajC
MDLILLANTGNAGYSNLIFMGLIFAVAYFFLIRPQAKRTREQQKFVKEIEKGDQVVTTSGIYGKIMEVDGDAVIMQIDKNKGINIKITRAAISKEFSAATEKA